MDSATVRNVVGAFAQALMDAVEGDVGAATDQDPTSAAALVHLSKYGGAGINALRVPLEMSQPGCVRLVDRLEEQRLVTRGAAADRRAVALRLTASGRAAARRALDRRGKALDRALAALTGAERTQLGRLAGKVLEHLIRDEPRALQTCRLCDYDACPDAVCPVTRALASRS